MCKDYLGQEVSLGDWCAVTQHNQIFIGKVVKVGNSVQIAIDSCNEFLLFWKKDPKNPKNKWDQQNEAFFNKFGITKRDWYISNNYATNPTVARDGKFIKVCPTIEMEKRYDFKPKTTSTP